MPRDLLEINILNPNEQSVKDQARTRLGITNQKEWKYFDQNNETQEKMKKRYPFLY